LPDAGGAFSQIFRLVKRSAQETVFPDKLLESGSNILFTLFLRHVLKSAGSFEPDAVAGQRKSEDPPTGVVAYVVIMNRFAGS
jgi:hypothetical protein